MTYKCPICGNQDVKYVGMKNGELYCRKCLSFKNKVGDIKEIPGKDIAVLKLDYELTNEQKNISDNLIKLVDEEKDVLIHAVCGAGKTEIITGIMHKYLLKNQRIGIFIPRKDLVVEIGERLKYIFINTTFSLVYGGHTSELNGSVVIATTHQAFRFNKTFDLVIIDEIDAFPFKGDELLNYFVLRSAKKQIVSLSATPSLLDKENKEVLSLFKRFHGFPLPVPINITAGKLYLNYVLFKLLKKYKKENKPCFIYVPSIRIGQQLKKRISAKYKNVTFLYSSVLNRENIIKQIRRNKYDFVVTTTILERGVTFENLQVIVYLANHFVFDEATLLQICGRVGRKKKAPNGDIYLLSSKKEKKIENCIKEVKKYNENM